MSEKRGERSAGAAAENNISHSQCVLLLMQPRQQQQRDRLHFIITDEWAGDVCSSLFVCPSATRSLALASLLSLSPPCARQQLRCRGLPPVPHGTLPGSAVAAADCKYRCTRSRDSQGHSLSFSLLHLFMKKGGNAS